MQEGALVLAQAGRGARYRLQQAMFIFGNEADAAHAARG